MTTNVTKACTQAWEAARDVERERRVVRLVGFGHIGGGFPGLPMHAAWMADAVAASTTLTRFEMVGCAMTGDGTLKGMWTLLGRGLGACVSLTDLVLTHNKLTDDDVTSVLVGFHYGGAHLRSLSLDYNYLTEGGAGGAVHFAARRASFQHLSLAGNFLRDATMVTSHLSSHCPAFESLDLSGNPLGDDGARALAQVPGFLTSRSLLKLGLASCKIGEAGALALARVLQQRTTMCVVDLNYNVTTDAVRRALSMALGPTHAVATRLALAGRAWHPARAEAIQNLFKRDGDNAVWIRVMEFSAGVRFVTVPSNNENYE